MNIYLFIIKKLKNNVLIGGNTMRAKEIIDQKEIDNYEISIKKMSELSKVNSNDVVNFISYT